MSKLDYFHMVVVSNYIENKNDFINLMLTSKKNKKINRWYKSICAPFSDSKLFKCELKKPEAFNFICFYDNNSYSVDKINFKESKIKGIYINILKSLKTANLALRDELNTNNFAIRRDNMNNYYMYYFRVKTIDEIKIINDNLKYLQIPFVKNYRHCLHKIEIDIDGEYPPTRHHKMILFDIHADDYDGVNSYVRSDHQTHLETSNIMHYGHNNLSNLPHLQSLVIDNHWPKTHPDSSFEEYRKVCNNNPNLECVKFDNCILHDFDNSFNNNPNLKYVNYGLNKILRKNNFRNCHEQLTIKIEQCRLEKIYIHPHINYIIPSKNYYKKIGEKITDGKRKYYYIVNNGYVEVHEVTFENIDYFNMPLIDTRKLVLDNPINIVGKLKLKHIENLEEVYIPDTVLIMNDPDMFKNCHKLKRVILYTSDYRNSSHKMMTYNENIKMNNKSWNIYSETVFDLTGCYELEEFPFNYINHEKNSKFARNKITLDSITGPMMFDLEFDLENNTLKL